MTRTKNRIKFKFGKTKHAIGDHDGTGGIGETQNLMIGGGDQAGHLKTSTFQTT